MFGIYVIFFGYIMHVFKYIFQSSNNKYIQLDYVCNLSNDRLNLLILFHEFKM